MSTSLIIMGAAGRMGATVARLVGEAGDLTLAAVVERSGVNLSRFGYDCLAGNNVEELFPQCRKAVVVDFTSPEASVVTAGCAVKHGNPMVIGTTGFSPEQREKLEEYARVSPLFWSPNMSVGVNVLLKALPELTRLLGGAYDVDIVELHHNRKKDAPSGTALRLAECVAEAKDWRLAETGCYHREGIIGERPKREIGVQAVRGGDIVGVHTVYFMGPGERIELTHQAHSRENFAQGALRAARWMADAKPGKLYSMLDVL
ncbi:MAG: 4-hydroxy-tetrahydrodipicolinate reductase [Desulfovibrionaceae bacterium]|nr:4-hydroxy-tetrahydrodipicolinate reductase [Desulfovibrionaceae bacterium]